MSNMTLSNETTKRDDILSAAFSQFSQYGFQRTSMADIAAATGISRASLYTYFDNKEDIFRGACININSQSLATVAQLLTPDNKGLTITQRVEAALIERYGRLLEITKSPHGSEIYDEHNRLCGEIVQQSVTDLRALLTKALKAADKAGEINLKSIGTPPIAAAEILQLAAAGLKAECPDAKTYAKRLKGLVRIFFAGLHSAPSASQLRKAK